MVQVNVVPFPVMLKMPAEVEVEKVNVGPLYVVVESVMVVVATPGASEVMNPALLLYAERFWFTPTV